MTSTPEDLKLWYDSGDELFKYGKDIMGLDPAYMVCSFSTAIAKTLLLSGENMSNPETLKKNLLMLQMTVLLEIQRLLIGLKRH